MSTLGTITRRGLILGSVAMAGGVAFGYYKYKQPLPNPLPDALARGDLNALSAAQATPLNPYVLIDASGVTIITPRTELGQGVQSTLAALVAEELDVAWDAIRIEHGPPSATYYTDISASAAAPYDQSFAANTMRQVMAVGGRFLGLQVTGGSASSRDAFVKMRVAGAAARYALIHAAAKRWGVPAQQLSTEDGWVLNTKTNQRLPYSALAMDAAQIELPDQPALKPSSQWRYVGRSMPRKDMLSKCTGTATFAIDMRLPDMVYATVVSNPKRAGMNAFDTTAAQQMRGVLGVVPMPQGVAVVADNTWRAFQAAQAIRFDWQAASYPATSAAMFDQLRGELKRLSPDAVHRDVGDADAALSQAAGVLDVEYRAPHLAHAALEPISAVAHFTGDALHVWTGNQIPTLARSIAAKTVGLDPEQVHFHVTIVGGSFGRRTDVDYVVQVATIAKAMAGKPVKLTWTREEDMRLDFYRPAALGQFKGVMSAAGTPEAIRMDIVSASSTRSWGGRIGLPFPGPDRMLAEGAGDAPYLAPNHKVSAYASELSVPVGPWRSVGASYNGFFHECFLDELAHSKGVDPMAMRLAMSVSFPHAQAVLTRLKALSNWDTPLPKGRARGVAMTLSFGSYVGQVVEVQQTAKGIKVEHVYCVADVGLALDPRNIEAQLQSGIAYGLTAAMMGEITFADGQAQQSNFHDYPALRMHQMPQVTVAILEGGEGVQGIGEPGVPPIKAALANAIYALTGQRIREYPLNKHVQFV